MKNSVLLQWLLLVSVTFSIAACKKNAPGISFTARIDNDNYTFDSLFASVDTGNSANNISFIQIGAADTKIRNIIYFSGIAIPVSNTEGVYYYVYPQPYPQTTNFKFIEGFTINLVTGANTGNFALSGPNVSNFVITKRTSTNLQGNFSFTLNPEFANGLPDNSKTIYVQGDFNIPYKIVP